MRKYFTLIGKDIFIKIINHQELGTNISLRFKTCKLIQRNDENEIDISRM